MKITHEGKTINCLTVKELYEMAKAQGQENAIISISGIDDDDYCEQVNHEDIYFCETFRPFGWHIPEHSYPSYEIFLHEREEKEEDEY